MLSVDNISKSFGPQVLFRGATFSVEPAARIGVVGPNGAGKSTFFRMLAGIETPDEGTIRSPRNFRVGLMLQEWWPEASDSVLQAALRGHARWWAARERLRDLEQRLAGEPTDGNVAAYHDAEEEFSALGGFDVERQAKEILSGLGFGTGQFGEPARNLSGGWKIRCHLAGLFLGGPQLLLLDEPTNHLDVETVVWFENFLLRYPHAVMLVSHDRRMLTRLSRGVLEFAPPRLTLWPGTLPEYEAQKTTRIEQLQGEIANKEREIERLGQFIDRFRAKATKARQAQNRLKTVEHYAEEVDRLKASMPVVSRRPSRFRLKLDERVPRKVLEIERGRFGYEESRPLFELERCILEGGKKIGIIGVNGVGKSTFLKCCAGELPLLSGKLARAASVKLGYFAQHRMEQLPNELTAFEYLYAGAHGVTVEQVRGVAGSLGLSAHDVEKPIRVLSGGEKARVSLCRILLGRPGLLLLDEPTNHLDLEACDALARGLAEYQGTVLVVSHDRDFLDELVDYLLEITPGRAFLHHGNYSDWFARREGGGVLAQAGPGKKGERTAKDSESRKTKEEKRREAEERQRRYRAGLHLARELREIEAELERRRAELKALDELLCLSESPRNPDFPRWLRQRAELERQLRQWEEKWLDRAGEME